MFSKFDYTQHFSKLHKYAYFKLKDFLPKINVFLESTCIQNEADAWFAQLLIYLKSTT